MSEANERSREQRSPGAFGPPSEQSSDESRFTPFCETAFTERAAGSRRVKGGYETGRTRFEHTVAPVRSFQSLTSRSLRSNRSGRFATHGVVRGKNGPDAI